MNNKQFSTGKKIIQILLVSFASVIFIASVLLQSQHPEWFIVDRSVNKPIDIYFINNTDQSIYDSSKPPELICNKYDAMNCTYVNIPTDEPYITKTPYGWIYTYKNLIAILLLVIATLLYWERFKQWKDTFSN